VKDEKNPVYSNRIQAYKNELVNRQKKVNKLKEQQLITIVVMFFVFGFSIILFFKDFFGQSGDMFNHFINVFFNQSGAFLFVLFFLSLSINLTLEKELKKAKDKSDKLKSEVVKDIKSKSKDSAKENNPKPMDNDRAKDSVVDFKFKSKDCDNDDENDFDEIECFIQEMKRIGINLYFDS
jgi:hypothetical protein